MLQTTELPRVNPGAEGTNPAIQAQVRRIVLSLPFRNCPVLQSFLVCITEKAIEGRESEINEHLIARDVFSRVNFDPATDTIVRTQAYRLRLKLQEYYRDEGKHDAIVIEIPKGHYIPIFQCAGEPPPADPEEALAAPEAQEPVPGAPAQRPFSLDLRRHGWWLAMAAAVPVFILGWALGAYSGAKKHEGSGAESRLGPPHPSVEAFWRNFLQGDNEPILAYTNTRFLATEHGDLLSFSGGIDAERGASVDRRIAREGSSSSALAEQKGPIFFENDFTGVGEVTAAVSVSNVLSSLGAKPAVKRGGLITAYDLRNHNVIFLGSPFVNRILTELPRPAGFLFQRSATGALWNSRIENLKPAPGEPPEYKVERDPVTGVLRTDFATVSLLPGISPGRRILILAGLTTSGTEAAAEAASGPRGISEIESNLGVSSNGNKWPGAFQTVWRVELSRGLDVIQSSLVAKRALQN
ncbi:MAG TPA: hypothetical protein VHD76_04780 [Bryobacteraceae bacterium]|jgi:hypothetical protein|nr:hypothetical protein [Bryobacteraceae bacterium]